MNKIIYAILSVRRNHGKLNALLEGIKGISGENLYAVSLHKISAVVCDSRNAGSCADKAKAIEFAQAIESISQQFTLVPVRFGSVMESNEAIIKMLGRNYDSIQLNLQRIENKVEFGLKVFCDSRNLLPLQKLKSGTLTETICSPAREIKESVYRVWVNKKLEEHRLEESLLTYIDSIVAEIERNLIRLNAVFKFKKMATSTNIIDCVFLLEKDKKDNLINIVNEFQNRYPCLHVLLTGPWPPYSFVDFPIN